MNHSYAQYCGQASAMPIDGEVIDLIETEPFVFKLPEQFLREFFYKRDSAIDWDAYEAEQRRRYKIDELMDDKWQKLAKEMNKNMTANIKARLKDILDGTDKH